MSLSNNIITLLAALVAIGTAILSIFSTLNYDSFDRKLMPRNKSMVTYLKQITGVFLITIPVFIFASYAISLSIIKWPILEIGTYLLFLLILIIFLVNKILLFLEWLSEFRLFKIFKKFSRIFKFNSKLSNPLIFIATFILLIIYARINLQEFSPDSLVTVEFLKASIPKFLFMASILVISLAPLYANNNEKKYKLLITKHSGEDLLQHLKNKEIEIQLDYFLTENVAIFSSPDNEIKVVRRYCTDHFSYEIYEVVEKL